jgi:enterochelin esterase-like enzyme
MSLTGRSFFVCTAVLVIVLPVVMLLVWHRVPGPWPVRVAARLSMVVLSQATAVLAVLVWLNNTYSLYQSWGELFGTGTGTATVTAPVHLAMARTGGKLTFTHYKGGILTTTATGPSSHITGDLYVWLPPQYTQPAYRHTDFPVVELLPGYPGSPRAWFDAMGAQTELAAMITAHQVRPMILVAPKMNVLGFRDPGCADIPNGVQTSTWLGKDIPALVKQNFRAAHDAGHWATMGYSAGAYCAVNLTVQHPGTFHAAVSLSGYNAPSAGLVMSDPALARANNLYLQLRNAKHQPDIALLMAGSKQDGNTVYAAKSLLSTLHHPGASRLLTVPSGGHNTRVWRAMLPTSLTWISTQMPA